MASSNISRTISPGVPLLPPSRLAPITRKIISTLTTSIGRRRPVTREEQVQQVVQDIQQQRSADEEITLRGSRDLPQPTAQQVQKVQPTDTGRLMVTQEKAPLIKGGTPFWTLQSKQPAQQAREIEYSSLFAERAPSIGTGGLRTRGDFERTQADFIAGERMFTELEGMGTQQRRLTQQAQKRIDAGEDFEKVSKEFQEKSDKLIEGQQKELTRISPLIYREAQLEARERFEELPKDVQRRMKLLSTTSSAQRALIGISDFFKGVTADALFGGRVRLDKEGQIIRPAEEVKKYDPKIVKDIRASATIPRLSSPLRQPISYAKETVTAKLPEVVGTGIVYAPMIASGVGGIKGSITRYRKGTPFKQIVQEGLAGSAPVRMADKVYKPTASPYIRSKKAFTDEGIARGFGGVSKRVRVKGFEVATDKTGAGFIRSDRPFTEVRAGGSIVETGRLTNIQPYTIQEGRLGDARLIKGMVGRTGLKGSVTPARLTDGTTIFRYDTGATKTLYGRGITPTRTGAAFTEKGGITYFKTGKLDPQTALSYRARTLGVDVRGVETVVRPQDLGLTSSSGVTSGFKDAGSSATKQLSKLQQGFKAPSTPQTLQAPIAQTLQAETPVTVQTRIFTPYVSPYTGTGQYELTTAQTMRTPTLQRAPTVRETPTLSFRQPLQFRQLLGGTTAITTTPSIIQRQPQIPVQRPIQRQPQPPIQKQPQPQPFPTPFPTITPARPFIPRTPTRQTPTPRIPPFSFPKPFGFLSGMSLRDFGGTRRFRYTPSFKALVLNIKGTRPRKRRFTGLELRPIIGRGFFS